MRKYLLSLGVILLLCQNLFAQNELQYSGFFDSYYYRFFNITAGGGISAYRGDLSQNLALNSFGFNGSLGAHYRLWPRMMFGAEFTYFTLGAEDQNMERNISFVSTNWELTAISKFFIVDDIVRVARDRNKPPRFSKPYLFTGIGFLRYNPVSTQGPIFLDGEPVPFDTLFLAGERRYPASTLVVPVGFGVSFYVSPKFSILTEMSYRFTFTDHLDDVSFRGNNGGNDGFALFSMKLQYTPFPP
ncbi:MAG: hypothetical protein ACK4ND_19915, partial [Cytophagaceae bacterium]